MMTMWRAQFHGWAATRPFAQASYSVRQTRFSHLPILRIPTQQAIATE